jgi:hypothetical protein
MIIGARCDPDHEHAYTSADEGMADLDMHFQSHTLMEETRVQIMTRDPEVLMKQTEGLTAFLARFQAVVQPSDQERQTYLQSLLTTSLLHGMKNTTAPDYQGMVRQLLQYERNQKIIAGGKSQANNGNFNGRGSDNSNKDYKQTKGTPVQ